MLKLLITGSNGLLGQKLLAAEEIRSFSVVATSRRPDVASGNYTFDLLDITQKNSVESCLARHKPDVLIHTAAMTMVDACEQDQKTCWDVNVKGTENLVRACERSGTHFIHLSTDFIFDGTKGPYREEDPPNPINYYGLSKWESEKIVRACKTPWTIIRTILVYGIVPHLQRSNIVLFFKNNLEQQKQVKAVTDQYRMPTLAEDLAHACLEAAQRKAAGTFHISGNELVSIYEFARIIAEVFQLDPKLIHPIASQELKEAARRPTRTGFIIEKAAQKLAYKPHSLREGLESVRLLVSKKGI